MQNYTFYDWLAFYDIEFLLGDQLLITICEGRSMVWSLVPTTLWCLKDPVVGRPGRIRGVWNTNSSLVLGGGQINIGIVKCSRRTFLGGIVINIGI